MLTTVVISPYLIRNIILVDKITITKSIGYNLWKGNNPDSDVEGNPKFDFDLKQEVNKISRDSHYDIHVDKVFEKEGLKNIRSNPVRYFSLYLKKILSFIFIDINSSYPNYYHPLHYFPVLLIGITSALGIFLSNKNYIQMNFLILYFMANIAIMSIFFILPRYSLAILPLQIIFSNVFFEYIKKRIKHDSIYRLLSPLLSIFFEVPNGKKIKSAINASIKNYEVDKLEFMFLNFMKERKI